MLIWSAFVILKCLKKIHIISLMCKEQQTCVCNCAQLSRWASWRCQAAPLLPSAGLTGVGWVVVGQGAGWWTDVKVCCLGGRRHGGVWGGQARVWLLVLKVRRGIPGQNAVLHTLRGDKFYEHSIFTIVQFILLGCLIYGYHSHITKTKQKAFAHQLITY